MKVFFHFFFFAGNIVSLAAGSTCRYLDGFGSDFCANADAGDTSWIGQAACNTAKLTGTGCEWNGSSKSCFQDPQNCVGVTENNCNSVDLAKKGCFWSEAGRCDAYDAMSCTGSGTGFHTCTHAAWDTLVQDVLSTVDPFNPNTWNIGDLIADFARNMATGCFRKFRDCFYLTECGNPELVVVTFCEDAITDICQHTGIATSNCPLNWCQMGVTTASSLIDITLNFADNIDVSSFYTDAKILELRETIEMIAGGGFDIEWIEFDPSNGKVKITIPENSIVSKSEIDDIIARLRAMLSGNSGSLMTSDKGFAVQNVEVKSEIAPIESSKSAWEDKVAEAEGGGIGAGAIIGIFAACLFVVGSGVAVARYRKSSATGRRGGGTSGINMQGTKKNTGGYRGKGGNMV